MVGFHRGRTGAESFGDPLWAWISTIACILTFIRRLPILLCLPLAWLVPWSTYWGQLRIQCSGASESFLWLHRVTVPCPPWKTLHQGRFSSLQSSNSMMDAASSVMGSSQPAEGLQQLLGATGLDTSALFSFFGESKEYQPSHSDNRSVINQAPSLDRSGHVPSRSSSVSAAASAGDARLRPSSVERLSEDGTRSLHIPSPAKSPFEDRGAPVTAAQLASALVEAADAAKVRSPAAAASPCPDPSPDAGAMMADPPLAQGFHNNIVPAPHIPSVHEASGALSSASGDEEPPLIPLPQIFTGEKHFLNPPRAQLLRFT